MVCLSCSISFPSLISSYLCRLFEDAIAHRHLQRMTYSYTFPISHASDFVSRISLLSCCSVSFRLRCEHAASSTVLKKEEELIYIRLCSREQTNIKNDEGFFLARLRNVLPPHAGPE